MEDMAVLVRRSRALEAEFRQHGPDQTRCALASNLIDDVAQAGAGIGRLDDRLLLHSVMDYWASVLRLAGGMGTSSSEAQEIVVPPPLAAFNGSLGESEDPIFAITLDEFKRLVERGELISTKKLTRASVPAFPGPVKVSIVDSRFRECTLTGVRFADGSRFITASFIKCHMDSVVACRALFVESRFDQTDLSGANFRESDFTRALFMDSRFDVHTHFLQANFTSAKLQDVQGQEVTFTDVNFTTAELSNAKLINCKFDRANLKGAKLWRSDFRGSDFAHASLKESDLDGASFVNCNLEDANFEGARNIERADFTGSTWRAAKFDPLVQEVLALRSADASQSHASSGPGKIVDLNLRTGTHE